MDTLDPRVDAYIAQAPDFARPLLTELRRRVHAAGTVTEAVKWRHPAFLHDGHIVAYMAAFKAHVAFGFWKARSSTGADGMGQFGRIADPTMLPAQQVIDAGLRDAIARHAAPAAEPPRRAARPEPPVPDALRIALGQQPRAKAHFEAFAPSHRREYVEWITEARREETRARRVAQAVEWLAEGRTRHWKYARS